MNYPLRLTPELSVLMDFDQTPADGLRPVITITYEPGNHASARHIELTREQGATLRDWLAANLLEPDRR